MSIEWIRWRIYYSLFRHVKISLILQKSLTCLRFWSSLDCLLADSNLNIEVRKLAFEILLTVDAYSVRRHIASLRLCKSHPRARFIRLCTVDRALMNFPIFYSAAGVAIVESQPLLFLFRIFRLYSHPFSLNTHSLSLFHSLCFSRVYPWLADF